MTKRYYHLTSFKNSLVLREEGIKAGPDGYIYLLDTRDWDTHLAFNQLGLSDFAVFAVDPKGIEATLEQDEVDELPAEHQFRIKQPLIDKKFLVFKGMFRNVGPSKALLDNARKSRRR